MLACLAARAVPQATTVARVLAWALLVFARYTFGSWVLREAPAVSSSAHAALAQPAASSAPPCMPGATIQPPKLASIGSSLAYGLCSAAYWMGAARVVAVCSSAASSPALRGGPVAALLLDPSVLPHAIVLLLSLEPWGRQALADLTAIRQGLPAVLDLHNELLMALHIPFLSIHLRGLLALPFAMASWDHMRCAVALPSAPPVPGEGLEREFTNPG